MNRRNALGKPAGVRAPFVSFVLLVAPPYLILSPDPPCPNTPGTAHILIAPYSLQVLNAHVIITLITIWFRL